VGVTECLRVAGEGTLLIVLGVRVHECLLAAEGGVLRILIEYEFTQYNGHFTQIMFVEYEFTQENSHFTGIQHLGAFIAVYELSGVLQTPGLTGRASPRTCERQVIW
jgi:hypothetical protein